MKNILGTNIFVEKHKLQRRLSCYHDEKFMNLIYVHVGRYINVINMSYDQRGEIEEMLFKCVTIYDGGHCIIM